MQTRPGNLKTINAFSAPEMFFIGKRKGVIIPERGLWSPIDKPLWLGIGCCVTSATLFSIRRKEKSAAVPRTASSAQLQLPSPCPGRKDVIAIKGECERFLAAVQWSGKRWVNSLSTPSFTAPEATLWKADEIITKIWNENPEPEGGRNCKTQHFKLGASWLF